ncbi:hypothetical protein I310_05630 [Cryptococcus deuterogattii CA1014]|nr:hypothetical protein I310_05630 [Cryptococcus deuterogattii CA1014]
MSAYLDEQTPHLRHLHAQLSLPSTALEQDLHRIEAAIKAVITSIIREREAQVDQLKDDIAATQSDLATLQRAVGDRRDHREREREKEGEEEETLPRQLERLNDQAVELKKVYDERLVHIKQQQSTLDRLSTLLGPPWQPMKPLEVIASSSRSRGARAHSASLSGPPLQVPTQAQSQMATCSSSSLGLKVKGRAKHMVKAKDSEEQPGLYASYERLLHTIIALNPLPPMDDGNEEWPVVDDLEGFKDTEPEIPLIEWVEETMELWTSEKEEHEARIQELYNMVEPLWTKLGVEQETMDCFVEMNRGSGEATIKAYEAEYERLLELRRASLSSFILSTRSTIVALQTSLLMSPRSQSTSFPAMHDEEYTEDLLHLHEKEIERLEEEVESKKNILPKVREWFKLVEDEEELERNEKDPNRFSRRGGAMLREEKLRKRRAKQGLLPLHPAAGGPSRTLAPSKTIRATPSHASSSSSRSTRLTAATGDGTGNLYSKSSTALSSTSAAMGTGTGTGTGTTRLGKRPIGPGPTPTVGNKRAKIGAGVGLGLGTVGGGGGGTTAGTGGVGVGRGVGRSVSSRSAVTGGGAPRGGLGIGGSPTPRHQRDFENYSQGQQRSVSYSSGIPSHSAAYPPSHTRLPTTTTTGGGGVKALAPAPKRGYNPLGGEGEVRRAPRKSFKPRSSMAAVGGTGIVGGVNSNGNGNGNGGGLGLGIEGLGGWREGLEGNDDGLEAEDDDVF